MNRLFIVLMIVAVSFVVSWGVHNIWEKKKFKESEYERGALFVVDWKNHYNEYPSYWARRHHFYNPELSVDSIWFLQDSLSNAFQAEYDSTRLIKMSNGTTTDSLILRRYTKNQKWYIFNYVHSNKN